MLTKCGKISNNNSSLLSHNKPGCPNFETEAKKRIMLKYIAFIGIVFFLGIQNLSAKHDTLIKGATIVKLKLQEQIDPKARRMTNTAFEFAQKINADAIVIDMNTPGGLLNEADSIRTKIIHSEIPVYVLVNPNAASAGALISIACNKIYMTNGSTIGAATVVTQNAEALPDKYQSYMRGMMRSTAEYRGRNPKIAEAMVDQELEVDSVSEKGKVLTLTRSEAIKVGYCDGKAESIEEMLTAEGYVDYEIKEYKLSGTDKIINFLINPFVHGILILMIMGGIYYELQSPGIGFPLAAAITGAVLYFAPLYIEDLAASWEILVFVVGLILLGLEIFVIPGFGIAGVSGIIFMVSGLTLALIKNVYFDFTMTTNDEVIKSLLTVTGAFTFSFVFILLTGRQLIRSSLFQRLVLHDTSGHTKYRQAEINNDELDDRESGTLVGQTGVTFTPMHPSGKVSINNEIYNAVTEGDFLEKNITITVLEDHGNTLIVRKV